VGFSYYTSAPSTSLACNGAVCSSSWYNALVTVTLSATDPGGPGLSATYYTTDGSTPTTSSTLYAGAFTVSSTSNVQFFSADLAGNLESVKSQQLLIDTVAPTTAVTCNGAACSAGPYHSAVSVTLSTTDNAGGSGVSATYYTTDGSTPTTSSTLYTGAFTVPRSSTVQFFSIDTAGNAESVKLQQVQITVILVSIAVTPAAPSIAKGTTQPFAATGTYSDGSTLDVTSSVAWSSSDTGVATIAAGGLATGTGQGTSQITATSGGVAGSTTLTVGPPTLVSIAVTPANPSIPKGTTQQFTATGTYSDGSTRDLTNAVSWASADPSVATITSTGLGTAIQQGTATMSASSGVAGSSTLTVGPAVLVSVAVTPANPTIAKGTTQPFTATGTYSDGSTQDLTGSATWASSDTSVATITSGGLATALTQGATTIGATSGGLTGSTTLTVGPAALVSIAVTPATPSIPKGGTQPFAATGSYSDGSTQDLTGSATWASSNTSVATISAGGLASGAGPGTSQISATSGGVTGSTTLTVVPPPLVSITVTPANPSIPKGVTQQFTATGTYSDGSTLDLTNTVSWASSDPSLATITSTGLGTAVQQGSATISASSGMTGSTTLTVGPAVLASIAVTPANPSIAKGTTKQFTATAIYSDGSTLDVTGSAAWTPSDASVATITSGGLATALKQGGTTISATSGGATGSTTLTVGPAALVSIAVTPADPSIPKGTTQQFTATGTYSDGSTLDVTSAVSWASSDPSVATIASGGLATALTQGSTTITASAGVTGSVTLTVGPALLMSVALTPATPSIPKGTTQQFTATGSYTDGSTQDLTGSATWASSNSAAATITAGGLASGAAQGTSQISATSGGVTGSTTLTVGPATPVSIAVTPTNPSIPKGGTQQFTATGTYTDGSSQDLTASATWASSSTAVATITAGGLASGAAQGTSQISATVSGVTGSTTLTVGPATLVSIAVTPANPTIAKGTTQQFTATGTYTDGSTQDLTSSTTWASSNTAVASVNASGLASGAAQGTSQISATVGGATGSTTLTVGPAVLVSIAVTPANPTIAQGTTQQFTATGNYSDGSMLDVTSAATWVSSNTSVATITSGALASGAAQGTTQISAALGAVTGSTALTVGPTVLVSIAITPANPSIAKGTTQQFAATGTYTDGSTQTLTSTATWASSNSAVATIAAGGLASGAGQGTSQVSATSGGVTGSTTLTVGPPTLVSIAVTPATPSIPKGSTQQFTATGTYTDASTLDVTASVTWASSNTAAATISAAGLATGVAQGSSQVSATLSGVTGSTTLTIGPAALVSIAVTPANPSIAKGNTQQFTATGTYTDATTQVMTNSVSWASSNTSVATITSGGLATGVAQSTSQISATSGSVTGSTTLTVGPAVLVSIAVTPANPTIPKGKTQQFSATGTFSDGSTQNLTTSASWVSSNTTVATISASGLATGAAQGSSQISASSAGVTGSTTLTVGPAILVSIAVTPVNPSIPKGTTQQFTATGTYSDGSTLDLTGSVTWTSSKTSVATITTAGLATAKAQGTSQISAKLGSVTGSTTLTVTAPALVSIAVTPANQTVSVGTKVNYAATGKYTDGSTKNLTTTVTWTSSDTTVATITSGGTATALKSGTVTISAKSGTVVGSTSLTVR